MSVCLSVSVRKDISGTTHAIFIKFLCTLAMSVARSSSGKLMIVRIAGKAMTGVHSAGEV